MLQHLIEMVAQQFPARWQDRLFVVFELAVIVCLAAGIKDSLSDLNRGAYQWRQSENKKKPSVKIKRRKTTSE